MAKHAGGHWGRIAAIGGGLLAVAGAAVAYAVVRERKTGQPGFTLVEQDDAIEIRDYPALTVAETLQDGDRKAALNTGFRRLASYIFGKQRADAVAADGPIAMTVPVLADRADGGRWRTRFVMPADRARDTLPEPNTGVTIAALPARRVAAIRFSGAADDASLNARERDLRLWLARKGYRPGGPAEHAFYNSPMIPPPLRRNEVLIPLIS